MLILLHVKIAQVLHSDDCRHISLTLAAPARTSSALLPACLGLRRECPACGKGQAENLRTIDLGAEDTPQQYVAQRARGDFIVSACQPEATLDLSIAAQTTEPTSEDIKDLNVRIQWQISNSQRGLTFIPLELNRIKLFIFTDGSFADNEDISSQLGFIIVSAEAHCTEGYHSEIKGNIVH